MSFFYFGISIWFWLSISVLAVGVSGLMYYRNKKFNNDFAILPVILIAVLSSFICIDLTRPINTQHSRILSYFVDKNSNKDSHDNFVKAVNEISIEKGILVNNQNSSMGKDVYSTFITKSDWNKITRAYRSQ